MRRPDSGGSGYDVASAWTQALLGAFFGGTAANAVIGTVQMADGDIERGLEKLVPLKQARDIMQAGRFASEGVTNPRGQKIVPDVSGADIASKAFGINPSSIAEAQERDRAKRKFNATWTETRLSLLDRLFDSEPENKPKLIKAIAEYNLTAPKGYEISIKDRYEYLRRRRKDADKPVVSISKKKSGSLESSVRF